MPRGHIIWKRENCWRRRCSSGEETAPRRGAKVVRHAIGAMAGNAAASGVGPIYALHVHGDVEGLRGGRQAPAQRHLFEIRQRIWDFLSERKESKGAPSGLRIPGPRGP